MSKTKRITWQDGGVVHEAFLSERAAKSLEEALYRANEVEEDNFDNVTVSDEQPRVIVSMSQGAIEKIDVEGVQHGEIVTVDISADGAESRLADELFDDRWAAAQKMKQEQSEG